MRPVAMMAAVVSSLPIGALADDSPVPTSMPTSMTEPPRATPATPPSYRVAPPTRREWYGWMNLTSDGAALALLIAGGSRNNAGLMYSSAFVYGFGGPTIHWAHEKIGAGFGSLGLRVGGPVVLGLTGCLFDNSRGQFGCLGGLALGAFVGIVAAVVVDAAVLAYEEVEVEPRAAVRFMPTASIDATPGRTSAAFGVAGVF